MIYGAQHQKQNQSQKLSGLKMYTEINPFSHNQKNKKIKNPDWVINIELLTNEKIFGWIAYDILPSFFIHNESNFFTLEICEKRTDVILKNIECLKNASSFLISFKNIDALKATRLKFHIEGNGYTLQSKPIISRLLLDSTENTADNFLEILLCSAVATGFFNPEYYKNRYLPNCTSTHELMVDYLEHEKKEWRCPSEYFDPAFYIKNNEDVATNYDSPLIHFLAYGYKENRDSIREFESRYYETEFMQGFTKLVHPIHHYMEIGIKSDSTPVSWLDKTAIVDLKNAGYTSEFVKNFKNKSFGQIHPNFLFRNAPVESNDKEFGKEVTAIEPPDIIISFYNEPHLIKLQEITIIKNAQEIRNLNGRLILIYDSPENLDGLIHFKTLIRNITGHVDFLDIVNNANVGFLASVNSALQITLRDNRTPILLNSDAFITKGALSEMMDAAASDPMIGFVNPRSNNATICSTPTEQRSWGGSYAIYNRVKHLFPKVTFTPTGVGFCLLIKKNIIKNFGGFGYEYKLGYNEENDLVARANRFGYRSAIANKSYVFHIGSESFHTTIYSHTSNEDILDKRYPEFKLNLDVFNNSFDNKLNYILSNIYDSNGRIKLLIDASNIGAHTNGTSIMCVNLIRALSRLKKNFVLHVLIDYASAKFHSLTELNINILSKSEIEENKNIYFGIVFRIGQPFHTNDLFPISTRGFAYIPYMLDPIAYDCKYLWDSDKEDSWNITFHISDAYLYISDTVKKLFDTRFSHRNKIPSKNIYLSTTFGDYAPIVHVTEMSKSEKSLLNSIISKKYILIVGNKFDHKDIHKTYLITSSKLKDIGIVVLGDGANQNIFGHFLSVFLKSGEHSEAFCDSLYRNSVAIIYPSHYEGFGIPIVLSAGYNKKLICRKIPATVEISELVSIEPLFYEDYEELSDILLNLNTINTDKNNLVSYGNWESCAAEIASYFTEVIKDKSLTSCSIRHAMHRSLSK